MVNPDRPSRSPSPRPSTSGIQYGAHRPAQQYVRHAPPERSLNPQPSTSGTQHGGQRPAQQHQQGYRPQQSTSGPERRRRTRRGKRGGRRRRAEMEQQGRPVFFRGVNPNRPTRNPSPQPSTSGIQYGAHRPAQQYVRYAPPELSTSGTQRGQKRPAQQDVRHAPPERSPSPQPSTSGTQHGGQRPAQQDQGYRPQQSTSGPERRRRARRGRRGGRRRAEVEQQGRPVVLRGVGVEAHSEIGGSLPIIRMQNTVSPVVMNQALRAVWSLWISHPYSREL